MTDILEKIGAYKREEIAAAKSALPLKDLEDRAKAASPSRGFADALRTSVDAGRYALIAEIKKRARLKALFGQTLIHPHWQKPMRPVAQPVCLF